MVRMFLLHTIKKEYSSKQTLLQKKTQHFFLHKNSKILFNLLNKNIDHATQVVWVINISYI